MILFRSRSLTIESPSTWCSQIEGADPAEPFQQSHAQSQTMVVGFDLLRSHLGVYHVVRKAELQDKITRYQVILENENEEGSTSGVRLRTMVPYLKSISWLACSPTVWYWLYPAYRIPSLRFTDLSMILPYSADHQDVDAGIISRGRGVYYHTLLRRVRKIGIRVCYLVIDSVLCDADIRKVFRQATCLL